MAYTYSGTLVIPPGKFSSGIFLELPDPGFPDSNYSVSVNSVEFENANVFVRIRDELSFWVGGNPGTYLWIATNQNGSGGGGEPGPAGPTGATGATGPTGAIEFSGPTASILWYDGSGVTGTETFKWRNGEIYGYTIYGGPNENTIMFDDGAGSMQINISQINSGKSIGLNANSTYITLVDETAGEPRIPGSIQIGIDGIDGTAGQYLGSDGAGNVVWSTPPGTTFNYIGTWIAGSYAVNTLAVDPTDNNTYVCIVQTEEPYLADPPSTLPANWTLFVNGGAAGTNGVTGATGADGQSSSYFDYQAQVNANPNPTTGHITWQNATQINSTYIRVNHINQDGVDIDIFLNLVQEGNTLIIQDKNVSANFQRWVVDGTPIPNTGDGFVEYPVALVASSGTGTTNFANNHQLILATIVPGPQGPAGPTGATGPLDPGLFNVLQIVPTVSGQESLTVTYTALSPPPNSWVGATGFAEPLSGGTQNGWRNFKQVGVTGPATQVQWSMYSPYFGQGVTYTSNPTPTILKKDLSTVWAVITTKNRINVQGTIFFNIYTYDITNPPTAPDDYTNRFDYSIAIYPTMYGGPTTVQQSLAGGFRYLICAVDSPKTSQQTLANRTVTLALNQLVTGNTYTILTVGSGVNWTSIGAAVAVVGCVFVYNGTATTGTLGVAQEEVTTALLIGNLQTPEQTTFLRDPYDIYTTIPHVPFNAVTGASKTPQPADISNVAVSKIVIGSTSGALSCPTLDWTVEACGYSSIVAGVNKEFILKYT